MKRVPIVICAGLISVLCLSGCGASLPQEEAAEQIPVYLFEEKPDPGIPYFGDLSQEPSLSHNIPEHILTAPKVQKLFAAMGFNEFEEGAEENGKNVWRSAAPLGDLTIEGDTLQIVTAIRFIPSAGNLNSNSKAIGQFLSAAVGADISSQDKDSLLQLLTALSEGQCNLNDLIIPGPLIAKHLADQRARIHVPAHIALHHIQNSAILRVRIDLYNIAALKIADRIIHVCATGNISKRRLDDHLFRLLDSRNLDISL